MKHFFCVFSFFLLSQCGNLASPFFIKNTSGKESFFDQNIFVVTWNSEYSSGSKKMRSMLKEKILSFHKKPEVLAVCVQEAKKEKKIKRQLGRKLGKELNEYSFLEEEKIIGTTKISKGKNFTGLTLLAQKDFLKKIDLSTLVKGTHQPNPLRGTKGGVWISFNYKGSKTPLVVACAHLSAKNKETRKKNLLSLTSSLERLRSKKIILSGDTNYRIDRKTLGLNVSNNRKERITVKEFTLNYLLKGNQGFLDLSKGSLLEQDFNEALFDCSGYENPFILRDYYPPTYKLSYKSPQEKDSCTRYRQTALKLTANADQKYKDAKSCYFSEKKDTDPLSLKAFELNIGYLDHICLKKEGKIRKIFQGSFPIFESDHTPVWALLAF